MLVILFFFNDTAPTEIYTLSLHDALPISTSTTSARARGRLSGVLVSVSHSRVTAPTAIAAASTPTIPAAHRRDRKSTRLNSSHANISYAVFCLKKKKTTT